MYSKKQLENYLNKEVLKGEFPKEHFETLEHMRRCYDIALSFGKFINLNEKNLELLVKSAFFHDIGKLFVNPNVLYKKGKLTEAEFSEIKGHTLCDFKFNEEIINDVIKFHHERPDMRGYYGCDENKLSDFIKIISIIDSFDVMTHKRCYKDSVLSKEDVLNDIKSNLGKQFDENFGLLFLNFLHISHEYKKELWENPKVLFFD